MSGAEAIAVLGVISSIISIVDGTKQVYDAATNSQGLPEAFREVAGRLPTVRNILSSAKQNIDKRDADDDSCMGVMEVVGACEKKAKKLDDLFHKTIPADGASDLKRYYKAVKAYGKGNEVENLMKGMLEDVQLLAGEHGMKTMTKVQKEEIAQAITEVSAIAPSVPENVFWETGFTNKNYGPGTQYNAQGENIAQGSARQYNSAGGAMYFVSPEKDEGLACLAALFLTDPRDDREKLIQTKGSRVDGTCEWIKTNSLYKSWLCSQSQLLWLSGGPGKGKTMLSIFLAEELERAAKNSQDVSFLQYFCDNKDEKRNTAVAIIRGMIFQLLQLRPKLIDHILPSFKIQKESLFSSSSFETLWRILETMLRDPVLGIIYCVLDGLDECDEASLAVLLKKFKALFSSESSESSTCHLNLIVVSRDHPDFISEMLSNFSRIRLDPDADKEVNNDIHRFIEVKINELSTYRQYPELLRVRVENVFRDRAQGTFLWVGIVAQALRKYKATEVEVALDLFPSDLEELYARMLLQIDPKRRETAAKILRWTVIAIRPLTLSELSVAIDVKPAAGFSCEEVTRDQVSYCGYFIKIKEDEVGLFHQSVKDYLLRESRDPNPELESFRVKKYTANLEVAQKCFHYLQNGAFVGGEVSLEMCLGVAYHMEEEDTSRLKDFPLLSYAAMHWHEHARSLARSEDIFELSLPFYAKESLVRISWLKVHWDTEMLFVELQSVTLLHIASRFGILPLAENLVLKKGWINRVKRLSYINQKDGDGRTALSWAAEFGHEAVVRLLLEKGADVKAREKSAMFFFFLYRTPVRSIFDKARPDVIRSNFGKAVLHIAAQRGHEAIVRLLLEKGADVDIKNTHGETALFWAAYSGHEAIIQLLLEKEADVNIKNKYGETVLFWAATSGQEAIIRLLLEKGVEVEAKNMDGETAVYWAAIDGHEAIVRLLLEKGVDVEAKNTDGETVVYWAAKNGHEAIVRLLTCPTLNL